MPHESSSVPAVPVSSAPSSVIGGTRLEVAHSSTCNCRVYAESLRSEKRWQKIIFWVLNIFRFNGYFKIYYHYLIDIITFDLIIIIILGV